MHIAPEYLELCWGGYVVPCVWLDEESIVENKERLQKKIAKRGPFYDTTHMIHSSCLSRHLQVQVHRQGFEHYRRSLLRDIATAEARVEAAAAARAAKRAKQRADRVGRHSRRAAQAQFSELAVADRSSGAKTAGGGDTAVRKEVVASVFGKKKKKRG